MTEVAAEGEVRGRPREKEHVSIACFLNRFEECKIDYLSKQHHYQFYKMLVFSLEKIRIPNIVAVDTVKIPGKDEPYAGEKRIAKIEYVDHGDSLRKQRLSKYEWFHQFDIMAGQVLEPFPRTDGSVPRPENLTLETIRDWAESITISLDYTPPRLRVKLHNRNPEGKLEYIDAALRCPECHGTDINSKVYTFNNKLYVAERDVDYITATGTEKYICCQGGHINWKISEFTAFLKKEGFILNMNIVMTG